MSWRTRTCRGIAKFSALVMLLGIAPPAFAQKMGAAIEPGIGVLGHRVVDMDGEIRRLGAEDGARPVALVFLEAGCMISRRYVPRLNAFSTELGEHGAQLLGVVSSPHVPRSEVDEFRRESGIEFPMILDASGDLAAKLGPEVVPEAFVVDVSDEIVYRGRIDDGFPAVGQTAVEVTAHDLRDAMTATLSGRKPEIARTQAVGCIYEGLGSQELPTEITYTRNIAPILNANCVACHQPDAVGPFALETYADARRRARMIAQVSNDGLMPPWQTMPGHGLFTNQRTLSERQLAVLTAWAEAGAPEGDAAELLPTVSARTGRTDGSHPADALELVMTMPEPLEIPADGEDIYRYYVLPSGDAMDVDWVITAIGFKSGDPEVVHHADYFIDYTGRARAADEADPEPGFSVFGTGGFLSYFDDGFLGAWGPGAGGVWELPDGTGIFALGGGDVVIEIHYHLNGKATTDQSSLSFEFADEDEVIDRHVGMLYAGTTDVDIPAGADDYWRRFWMEVPTDIQVYSVAAHMHYLGTDVIIQATTPEGDTIPILGVDNWDFRWQGSYRFVEPLVIPAGSRIDSWFRFDNTAENPDNQSSPPIRVSWGWDSEQEMAEIYLLSASLEGKDLTRPRRAAYASWFRPADLEMSDPAYYPVDVDSTVEHLQSMSPFAADAQTLLWTVASMEDYLVVLERLRSAAEASPANEQLNLGYGGALLMASQFAISKEEGWQLMADAVVAFDHALAANPQSWDARYGRAMALAGSQPETGSWQRAIEVLEGPMAYQEGMERERKHARTYVELAQLYRRAGEEDRANHVRERGAELFPRNSQLSGEEYERP